MEASSDVDRQPEVEKNEQLAKEGNDKREAETEATVEEKPEHSNEEVLNAVEHKQNSVVETSEKEEKEEKKEKEEKGKEKVKEAEADADTENSKARSYKSRGYTYLDKSDWRRLYNAIDRGLREGYHPCQTASKHGNQHMQKFCFCFHCTCTKAL